MRVTTNFRAKNAVSLKGRLKSNAGFSAGGAGTGAGGAGSAGGTGAYSSASASAMTDTLQVRSWFNLFWIGRANLPAIYYDSPEKRHDALFKVLPINCKEFQYPTKTGGGELDPLTVEKLQHCSEDRTHDFTLALIDFARWQGELRAQEEQAQAKVRRSGEKSKRMDSDYFSSGGGGGGSGGGAEWAQRAREAQSRVQSQPLDPQSDPQLHDWPEFILKMLNSPKQWHSWRKAAERGPDRERDKGGGDAGTGVKTKRELYFQALCAQYEELHMRGEGV
ncbi:hypothetical protein B484DRAFT_450635 [Ochromonadaceae sp. CCMP2298]|nr:hypothetical protein B484DRAFT_450635 [Ochromonadaceae sp. CCMP2298]